MWRVSFPPGWTGPFDKRLDTIGEHRCPYGDVALVIDICCGHLEDGVGGAPAEQRVDRDGRGG
jgi:hypothetical protein